MRTLTKFDHNFGVKNRLSFTWTKNGEYFNNAYDTDPTNPTELEHAARIRSPAASIINGDQYYGNVFRLNDTHMFSPTVVNTLTIGAHRLTHPEHDITVEPFGQNWGDKLGGAVQQQSRLQHRLPAGDLRERQLLQLGQLQAVGRVPHGLRPRRKPHLDQEQPQLQVRLRYQMMFLNTNNRNTAAGSFTFNRLSTSVPGDNSGNSGSSFASFMLGEVFNGGFTVPNTEMLRFPYHAFFVAGRLEGHTPADREHRICATK